MTDVVIYKSGLMYLSACVTDKISDDDATARINVLHPTGIDSPWRVSADSHFAGGQPDPSLCEQEPGRRHILFEC